MLNYCETDVAIGFVQRTIRSLIGDIPSNKVWKKIGEGKF